MTPNLLNPFIKFEVPPVGVIGGWVELGRTTLGAAADTITVSSLADKRYYMILNSNLASGTINDNYILNGVKYGCR